MVYYYTGVLYIVCISNKLQNIVFALGVKVLTTEDLNEIIRIYVESFPMADRNKVENYV